MQPFSYVRPASAADAVGAFAAAGSGARFIAGGTTLYDLMKLRIEQPGHLIDVTAIRGLDVIETGGDRLRFGALAPMSAVAADPVVLRDYPVLAEALTKAASQQLRNMATVGGNLLQRTRCMYFRNGAGSTSTVGVYPCNKRAPGSGCAAIGGLDRGQAVLGTSASCTAVSPGDWPVALTAMDATIEVLGPAGTRTLPIAELYRLPGDTPHLEFTLAPGEMITAITVPKTPAGRRSTYHKIRDRESYAFALASAAVALEMAGERVTIARIALGGMATKPWRAHEAEQAVIGQALTPETALAAGRIALKGASPGKSNGFKVELGARTVADALLIASARNRA
ncbi:FAD binding domain-containing protein [Sphingomonas sp.]|uniref:FAD binding domain-containing protein n=1 Tax=Sphingomonas sp. TaxID=28214 RepID=UPI0035BC30A9